MQPPPEPESFEGRLRAASLLSPTVSELEIVLADGSAFRPGDYVFLSLSDDQEARPFSLSDPPLRDTIHVCVKHGAQGGELARQLVSLKAGQRLICRGPHAQFQLPQPRASGGPWQLLLVATGTGIAPFHALSHQLEKQLRTGLLDRVVLLFGAHEPHELLFTARWQALATELRFHYLPVVSVGEPGRRRGWVQDHLQEALALLDPSQATAMLCGHQEMVAELQSALGDVGI